MVASLTPSVASLSERPLMQIVYDIYRSDYAEDAKEKSKKELIKRMLNLTKETFDNRLANEKPILTHHKTFLESITSSRNRILSKMGDSYNTPQERFKELQPLFGSSVIEHINMLNKTLNLIDLENSFVQESQKFVKAFEDMFRTSEKYYKWFSENEGVITIENTGSLHLDRSTELDLNEDEEFALSLLYKIPRQELLQAGEFSLLDISEQSLKILLNSPNLKIKDFCHSLSLHNQIRSSSSCFRAAQQALFPLFDKLLMEPRTSLVSDVIVLATPRMSILGKNYTDFYHEFTHTKIMTNEGVQDLWTGEAVIKRIRSLDESLQQLGATQDIFKQRLIEYTLAYSEKHKKISRNLVQFRLRLKAENKKLIDKSLPIPSTSGSAVSTPKAKAKTKTVFHPKKEAQPSLPSSEQDGKEEKAIILSDRQSRSIKPALVTTVAPTEKEKKEEDNCTPTELTSFPVTESSWTLVKDFTYHKRVSRWNFKFDRSMDRIPFSDYVESRELPLKSYVKHALTPEIDELIYDPTFSFHERLGEVGDNRERKHLIAKIQYLNPNGETETEEGVITYAFVKRGHQKVCIHRHFSRQPQGDLISRNKDRLFARINRDIREEPVALTEEASSEIPFAFKTTKSAPYITLGFISFDIPDLGVKITVFKHTL